MLRIKAYLTRVFQENGNAHYLNCKVTHWYYAI